MRLSSTIQTRGRFAHLSVHPRSPRCGPRTGNKALCPRWATCGPTGRVAVPGDQAFNGRVGRPQEALCPWTCDLWELKEGGPGPPELPSSVQPCHT